MERLTKRGNGHAYYPRCFKEPCYGSGCKIKDCPFETAVCERLAAYEDTGLIPAQVVNAKNIIDLAFADDTSKAERIRKLLAADDEGRVVVLPCKVGDTIYFVNAKQILEFTVVGYAVDETGISWVYSEHVDKTGNTYERTFSPDRIGKTTFLSREEAEKALRKMKGDTEK